MSKQSALITGAGRGLGRALAITLAARGHAVVLVVLEAFAAPALLRRALQHASNAGALAHEFGDLMLLAPARAQSDSATRERKSRPRVPAMRDGRVLPVRPGA